MLRSNQDNGFVFAGGIFRRHIKYLSTLVLTGEVFPELNSILLESGSRRVNHNIPSHFGTSGVTSGH